MTELTTEAKALVDRYVNRARLSMRGLSVDADEVENDIRAHVDEVFADHDGMVGAAEVHEVLERLGSPHQWVPEDEIPAWRRVYATLTAGPEDWRLAYLCFGLTIIGLITIPFGGVILLAGAVFLARGVIDLAAERDEPLGARRWLIYPPLVVISLAVAAAFILGPVGGFAAIGTELYDHGRLDLSIFGVQNSVGPLVTVIVMFTGVWWVLLAAIAALVARPIRWVLVPIANGFRPRHAWWLGGAGATIAIGSAIALAIM